MRPRSPSGKLSEGALPLIFLVSMILVLMPCGSAWSDSAVPGIYIGDFTYYPYGNTGNEAVGLFGIFLTKDQSAIIAAFPSPSIDAFASISSTLIRDVSVEADGAFPSDIGPFLDTRICWAGQFTPDAVSGDFIEGTENICSGQDWGDFAGALVSNTGSLTNGGGLYEGTISGEVTFQGEHWADVSGDIIVMISGDGTALMAIDACALHGPSCTIIDDAGIAQIEDNGTISAALFSGTSISGEFDHSKIGQPSCCSASGAFFSENGDYVSSGTWSVKREIPLCINFPGDLNTDCAIDLQDAVSALKLLSGKSSAPTAGLGADANGNGHIGLEDVIFIFQKISVQR